MDVSGYVTQSLKDGYWRLPRKDLKPRKNTHPRNNVSSGALNLLGSSQGPTNTAEVLAGYESGLQGKDLGHDGGSAQEVKWHDEAPEGKP